MEREGAGIIAHEEHEVVVTKGYNNTTHWSIQEVVFPSVDFTALGKSDKDDVFVLPHTSGKGHHRTLVLLGQPL